MANIFSVVFPHKCLYCGRATDNSLFCPDCEKEYCEEIENGCPGCNSPFPFCTCGVKHMENERLIYSLPYKPSGPSRALLLKLKNGGAREVVSELTDKMIRAFTDNLSLEGKVVTFVPRTPKSVRLYGCDQSLELARAFSKKTSLPLLKVFVCHPTKKEQKELPLKLRKSNADDRFFLRLTSKRHIKDKSIILIDDIVTSGATAKRCIELLKDAGARDVICLSAGRSVKHI